MTWRIFLAVLWIAIGVNSIQKSAADDTPFIDVYLELEVLSVMANKSRNKAFAAGLENYGQFAWGNNTLAEARKAAVNGCISHARKRLGVKGDVKCKILYENSSFIRRKNDLPNLRDYKLPQPDLPLVSADIFGSLSDSKAIVLFIHGCDGVSSLSNDWFNGWTSYFRTRNYAVVQPDSFRDRHKIICGEYKALRENDNVLRLRVAQTRRTLETLKKRFPKKKIYIWGHSEGGLISQLFDYKVSGIVFTGANCLRPAANIRSTPIYFIAGDNDSFINLAGNSVKLTDKTIRNKCVGYGTKGSKRFSIVAGGDHWVNVSLKPVQEGLDRIFGKP